LQPRRQQERSEHSLAVLTGGVVVLACGLVILSVDLNHHDVANRVLHDFPGDRPEGLARLVGDAPLGPFSFSTHDFLIGDPVGSLYSGKLVEGPDGRPYVLAWRKITPDGIFVGELADPFQVAVDGQGNL
jgi:beta-fructofuranosidase